MTLHSLPEEAKDLEKVDAAAGDGRNLPSHRTESTLLGVYIDGVLHHTRSFESSLAAHKWRQNEAPKGPQYRILVNTITSSWSVF